MNSCYILRGMILLYTIYIGLSYLIMFCLSCVHKDNNENTNVDTEDTGSDKEDGAREDLEGAGVQPGYYGGGDQGNQSLYGGQE